MYTEEFATISRQAYAYTEETMRKAMQDIHGRDAEYMMKARGYTRGGEEDDYGDEMEMELVGSDEGPDFGDY